jgi:hypothetical protein
MIVTGAGRQGERPSQTAQARPRTREEIQASIANARARIARDPAARDNVLKTLRANGINISGL